MIVYCIGSVVVSAYVKVTTAVYTCTNYHYIKKVNNDRSDTSDCNISDIDIRHSNEEVGCGSNVFNCSIVLYESSHDNMNNYAHKNDITKYPVKEYRM